MGQVLSRKENRVVIEGVNVRKKSMKKSQNQPKGQILDIERPIHISKVKICIDEKPIKLRVKVNKEKERELVYKTAKKDVLYRSTAKPSKAK